MPSFLTELPIVGPLFDGSTLAVVLRLLGLVVAVGVGVRLLKWAWGRGGTKEESQRSLVKQGRVEEAGDVASRKGDLDGALSHFVTAEAWLKAGHTARRLGNSKDAAIYFERAGDTKLAIAAYETSGLEEQVARLAAMTDDPSLLAKAAAWHDRTGDSITAGLLYKKAGRLRDAEECFMKGGAEGRQGAIQMYLDAYDERVRVQAGSKSSKEIALRAAKLLSASGQHAYAVKVCRKAGIDPQVLQGGTPANGSKSSGSGPVKPQPRQKKKSNDLSIDAPLSSVDSFIEGTPQGGSGRGKPRPTPKGDQTVSPLVASESLKRPKEVDDTLIDAPPTYWDDKAPPSRHGVSPSQRDVQGKPPSRQELADTGVAANAKKPDSGGRGRLKVKTQDYAAALLGVLDGEEASGVEVSPELTREAEAAATSAKGGSFGFSSDVTNRYSITGEIGEGGMGQVYKAMDLSLGREVALKFLSGSMAGDEMAMKFFLREARAAAALNHPAIVTVFDIGVLDGRPFICMEYVEGVDLGTRIEEQGAFDVGQGVNMTIQLAQALDYAHEQNVVHRDIKPPNVIQASGGIIKILDFGLAKAIQGTGKKSTVVAGTPEYMSPEQLAGREVDGRTDIFSLGVMLYEMLTNELPFEGALRSAKFEPATSRAAWLPTGVDAILAKALAMEPEDRYQRGNELAGALRKLA